MCFLTDICESGGFGLGIPPYPAAQYFAAHIALL